LVEDDDFDIMEYLENDTSARLMKNKEPVVASSSYHEEDPIVVEHVEGERAAHIVRSKGPVTKKIVASGKHSQFCDGEEELKPGCEAKLSLVLWKFADQDVKGKIENKLDSGESVNISVDCLKLASNAAIVGGVVVEAGGSPILQNTRAYVMVIDNKGDSGKDQISNLSGGWPAHNSCNDHDIDTFRQGKKAFDMEGAYVKVCNRRDGEDVWLDCVKSVKSIS